MKAEDPNWPRASRWLAEGSVRGKFSLALLGVPMNKSLTPGRCDLAPAAIRKALERFSLYDAETGTDVGQLGVLDRGDVDRSLLGEDASFSHCVESINGGPGSMNASILLGGDNSITRPGVHALHHSLDRCGLLTFDAHHDLRDLGSGLTNGNPVRALLQDGLPGRNIAQIGIQSFTNSAAYSGVAREAGIATTTAETVYARGIQPVVAEALEKISPEVDVIYVNLDMDVLDRAYAPACPGSRPGGLQPWMLRQAARLCGNHPKVRMMDIVEIDPTQDIADCTSLAAASCLLAFASGLLHRTMWS